MASHRTGKAFHDDLVESFIIGEEQHSTRLLGYIAKS